MENSNQPEEAAEPEQDKETGTRRSYANYLGDDQVFCPHKDLNLPASYEEVLERFKRLQVERAMEALN